MVDTGVVEDRFRAMGTDIHVVVVDGDNDALTAARQRIDDLEARWSRFRADSEISRLNEHAGEAIEVSDETVRMVTLAKQAWLASGGLFDPTVLGDMIRAGYDRSFDDLKESPRAGYSQLGVGCDDIEVVGNRVRLPPGTGFDPGGIGKGLAADIVAVEVMGRGAGGVCINIGGDLRVIGQGPTEGGWVVAIEHPWSTEPVLTVGLADGAVATSTTLRRTWAVDGERRHHLIDPSTGLPSDTDLTLVSVVAGEAWIAEVLAKAILLRGSEHPFDILGGTGAEALAVDDRGVVQISEGLGAFCEDSASIRTLIEPPPTAK